VFSFVVYQLAIAKTINLAIENAAFRTQISQNKNAPAQIKSVTKKIKRIEQLIGRNKGGEAIDIHQALLELVTKSIQKNKLILQDFPQPYESSSNGYLTKTVQLRVEGGFIDLLQLIDSLEKNYSVGTVVAVNFKTAKEKRTRKRKLAATLYIQNVKTEKHE
jgi:hypothetical protein